MKGGCLFPHLSGEKEDMYEDWFRRSAEEVVSALETDVERGLARETAAARLVELGANELAEGEKISALHLFMEQFKNPLLINFTEI